MRLSTSYTSSTPCLTAFLFQHACNLRDLHSFPTRRSSDLCSTSRSASAWDRSEASCTRPSSGGATERSDRKSTRLNSSHRCISYAVFCLKKKSGHHEVPSQQRASGYRDHSRVPLPAHHHAG